MKWIILFGLILSPVCAHNWYDLSCCGGEHCHPVPDGVVEETKDGVVVQGYGILSFADSRLHWSQDDKDHICEMPGKLICVYRRPKDM